MQHTDRHTLLEFLVVCHYPAAEVEGLEPLGELRGRGKLLHVFTVGLDSHGLEL